MSDKNKIKTIQSSAGYDPDIFGKSVGVVDNTIKQSLKIITNEFLIVYIVILSIVSLMVVGSFVSTVKLERDTQPFLHYSLILLAIIIIVIFVLYIIEMSLQYKSKHSGATVPIAAVSVPLSRTKEFVPSDKNITALVKNIPILPEADGTAFILSKDKNYSIPLYTFLGIPAREKLFEEKNDKKIYQNFCDDKDYNCIQNMWASPFDKSYIKAKVEDDDNKKILQVEFDSSDADHLSNVTIKPSFGNTFSLSKQDTLVIKARISPKIKNCEPNIAIGIRIINGYCQHWKNNFHSGKYKPYKFNNSCNENEYETISVSLKYNEDDGHKWELFDSDGNARYETKNGKTAVFDPKNTFMYILGVSLQFGSFEKKGNILGTGSGMVEISEIYFTKNK